MEVLSNHIQYQILNYLSDYDLEILSKTDIKYENLVKSFYINHFQIDELIDALSSWTKLNKCSICREKYDKSNLYNCDGLICATKLCRKCIKKNYQTASCSICKETIYTCSKYCDRINRCERCTSFFCKTCHGLSDMSCMRCYKQ